MGALKMEDRNMQDQLEWKMQDQVIKPSIEHDIVSPLTTAKPGPMAYKFLLTVKTFCIKFLLLASFCVLRFCEYIWRNILAHFLYEILR